MKMSYQRMHLVDLDPWLEPSKKEIYSRYKRFVDKLSEIENQKGKYRHLYKHYKPEI